MFDLSLEIASVAIIIGAVLGGMVLILATIFDTRHPQTRTVKRPRRWPQMTVLFYIDNDMDGLEDSLADLRRSRYPNLDIVLVDGSLSSAVKSQLREITKRTKLSIKTYSIRSPKNCHQALYQGYRRSEKGEIVLVIGTSTRIDGVNLRKISTEITKLGGQKALGLTPWSTGDLRLLTITDKLIESSILSVKKALSLTHGSVSGMRVDYAYPRQLVNKAQKPVPAQLANSVTVGCGRAVGGVNRFVEKLAVSLIVSGVVIIGLIALISAVLQISVTPLLLSYGLIIFWLIAVVWGDINSSISQKIVLSLTAPSAYIIMTVTLVVRASMKLAQQSQTAFNNISHRLISKLSRS